jgi:hypothetical protein
VTSIATPKPARLEASSRRDVDSWSQPSGAPTGAAASNAGGCRCCGFAFRKDDVASHQRLAGVQIVASPRVDFLEVSDRSGSVLQSLDGFRAPRLFLQRLNVAARRFDERRHPGDPIVQTLTGGYVRQLRDAGVGQDADGFARTLIEIAKRAVRSRKVLFGMYQERGRGCRRNEESRGQRQSQDA